MQQFPEEVLLEALHRETLSRTPKSLFELMPNAGRAYMKRHNNSIPHFIVKHGYFQKVFFRSSIIQWRNFRLRLNYLYFHKSKSDFQKKLNPI